MSQMLRVDLRIGRPRNDKGYPGDQLAGIELECDPETAWRIYRDVVDALTGQGRIINAAVVNVADLFPGSSEL